MTQFVDDERVRGRRGRGGPIILIDRDGETG